MDSASTHRHQQAPPILAYETSPATNTTFVHAHPSNFRAVVQHLTGSSSSSSSSVDFPPPPPNHRPGGPPPLHERREKAAMSMKKLEMIKLNYHGPNPALGLVSPVSTLDGLGRGGLLSPMTPTNNLSGEEEERAVIAEKGFYNLHPRMKSVSHNFNNADPPQLLPLFPLHSPSSSQSHDHHYHPN